VSLAVFIIGGCDDFYVVEIAHACKESFDVYPCVHICTNEVK